MVRSGSEATGYVYRWEWPLCYRMLTCSGITQTGSLVLSEDMRAPQDLSLVKATGLQLVTNLLRDAKKQSGAIHLVEKHDADAQVAFRRPGPLGSAVDSAGNGSKMRQDQRRLRALETAIRRPGKGQGHQQTGDLGLYEGTLCEEDDPGRPQSEELQVLAQKIHAGARRCHYREAGPVAEAQACSAV